jgi:hypothetical protein
MIHVTANYEIKQMFKPNQQKAGHYAEMVEICCESFRENLVDWDETVVLTGKMANFDYALKDVFYKLREMHLDKNVDVLYTDVDTVCIKKTEINYKTFNMFGVSSVRPNYPVNIPRGLFRNIKPFYLSNVRYFPKEMWTHLWKVGRKLADNWRDVWAYELLIYNAMYSNQKGGAGPVPILNSQWTDTEKIWPDRNAHIIHLHGSRNSEKALKRMRDLVEYGKEIKLGKWTKLEREWLENH